MIKISECLDGPAQGQEIILAALARSVVLRYGPIGQDCCDGAVAACFCQFEDGTQREESLVFIADKVVYPQS